MGEKITRRAMLGRSVVAAGGLLLAPEMAQARRKRRAVAWSEGSAPKNIYPNDINSAVAEGLRLSLKGWDIVTASLSDPEQGLPDSLLNDTDVLLWWGHEHHDDVKDALVDRIEQQVKMNGMGFIGLHSAHYSKPFKRLMGTPCGWKGGYVDDGSRVDLLVKAPGHPIARGVKDFTIPHTERYTEAFEVNPPETLVFDGLYTHPDKTTEESRQGMVWTVGKGQVFYFQPGHEGYPIFFQPEVRHVLGNAVGWISRKRR